MNAALFFYFAEVLSDIGALLASIGIAGIILFGAITLFCAIDNGEYHNRNWAWIVPTVCLVVACFIPSSKTMYMMAGAVLTEKAIDTKIGQQMVELLELKLDSELKKAKEAITKEKK